MTESRESHCTALVAPFLIAIFATSAPAQSSLEDYRARYGRAEMNITCADAAKAPFERGLLLLHSFAWPESRKAFEEASFF
jgi:hypothetical protein